MDDKKDDNTTNYDSTKPDHDIEVSGELESGDNSTSDHTVVVDPDQLIGPQVIDMIMNKPEFSFLIRYYSLLYQSLIPNCKLTINTLRQHISISDNIEQYIVGAASHRTSCQRLINFLLTHLHSEKDYMQFCYHINIISVMTNLPYKLIAEFHTNGNWGYTVPVHPGLSLPKLQTQVNKHNMQPTSYVDINVEAMGALSNVYHLDNCSQDNSLYSYLNNGALEDRADQCSFSNHCYHNSRKRAILQGSTTDKPYVPIAEAEECKFPQVLHTNTDFIELRAHYHNILHLMPDDYELTVGILQNYISDDQICAILSSTNSTIANKLILDYLIERMNCREELLDLCDQLENIAISHDLKIIINEIRFEVQQNIRLPIINTVVTTNTQSLLSSDQQHHSISPSIQQNIQFPVSATVTTNIQSLVSSDLQHQSTLPDVSKLNIQEKLRYEDRRLHQGFKYLQPPPLPSNSVDRQILLDEIITKLLEVTVDPNKYETTLTITGAGGYGKTTTVISLCHNSVIREHFTDGFIFIQLGPQATDPSIKLSRIYHLLTNQDIKPGDINHAEQEIKQLTSNYYHNLLVIIDDVWHVEDAEPLVKAFSNCKTVLTTRMNNIEQLIPSKQLVIVGPMTQNEARSLLTSGIINCNQLSQEDMSLLDELAQDVHLWPLLLSLVRGQLSHGIKQYHLSYHKAIQSAQTKLHHKGLTAFDKNNIESINNSRKLAVKACIEITLELLTKPLSDRIKTLIIWTGIGTLFQTAVLHNLWNIPEQEAEETVDVLWAYGLVQFTDITLSPNNITQHCVEVHAVISQYIIECMDSNEVATLSPVTGLKTENSVIVGLKLTHQQLYGVHDPSSLTALDYLKYQQSQIENVQLPFILKTINMFAVTDPHRVVRILQVINDVLMSSPHAVIFLSLHEEIKLLMIDCKRLLKGVHKLCKILNQGVQRNLYEKSYEKLIEIVEEFIKSYPICNIALKAVAVVKQIIPYCNGKLLHYMTMSCEFLQMRTHDYHDITTIVFAHIKLYIKLHKEINISLLKGSPDIELIYHYFISGNFDEEEELVYTNRLIKLQEVAPNAVYQQALQQ